MTHLRAHWPVFTAVLLLTLAIAVPAHAQNRLPDSTLYTSYFASGTTDVNWVTCGSLPQTEGCYGSGSLGSFTNACAVVQSVPTALNSFTNPLHLRPRHGLQPEWYDPNCLQENRHGLANHRHY